MRLLNPATAVALTFLAGCVGRQTADPVGLDHPANPAAAAAPVAQPSPTLSLAAADLVPSVRAAAPADQPSDAGAHAGHAGHASHAPAATAPAAGTAAVLYACPMHKDVTSTNPNDKCPKCKMKVNKPVPAGAGAAATKPASRPAAAGQHQRHHDHAAGGPK